MQYLQLPIGIAAGCAVALSLPVMWERLQPAAPTPGPTIAELRAIGPRVLPPLLDRFDHMTPGPERDAFEHTIDQVAGQRYATIARLYWYTDLGAAEAAARAEHKPILSLRMLGRLDDDLSCANSRLFRATLYANAKVSALLRDNFILQWSSERDVPKVTIDFGDGRRLERTTAGNSAHYILDDAGHVLDVLPGLYAPPTFIAELERARELADRVRGMTELQRNTAIVDFHAERAKAATTALEQHSMYFAQRMTVTKAVVERPDLRRFAPDTMPGVDDSARWVAIGMRLYDGTLDASSRALVVRLHTAAFPATTAQLTAMIDRLQRNIAGDTAIDELLLRPRISRRIVEGGGHLDFTSLNDWIYREVFHTPKSDRWLGLLPRTDFTGLPGDGVTMPSDI
jgi:hypothetical protein